MRCGVVQTAAGLNVLVLSEMIHNAIGYDAQKTRSSIISITISLDTTLFTLFSFPILIYVSFHRGKGREAERDEGLIGPAEEGYT